MRSERLIVTERCNQNCLYCHLRSPADDPAFVAPAAIEARLAAAGARKGGEIVISGGEPTLRNDLPRFIAAARGGGFERVVVETNAALLDNGRARMLRQAGLDLARVNLSGWGEGLDTVTRDPGGAGATVTGIEALLAAEVAVEITVVVVRSTAPMLPDLPAHLAARFGAERLAGILADVPLEGPEPAELVDYGEAAATLVALSRAARAVGIAMRLRDGCRMPPCVLPARRRPDHLFALTAGNRARPDDVRVAACSECRVADRCHGFARAYLDRHGVPEVEPVREERSRRRLSLIESVPEQIARELVTPSLHRRPDGTAELESIVRVNFHCNQTCRFCFVSTHLPAAPDDDVARAIRDAGARGARIVLSGGEPTLNPRLAAYVALASEHSHGPVQLQTNAVRLDDPAATRALIDAGLGQAFVSLHASHAELSDTITGAPGTFARTVAGIDNLMAARVDVVLNFVICVANASDLPAWVRFAAERWPGARLCISFVAPSTDVVPREPDLIPRYSDVLPFVAEALAEAERRGAALEGLEAMCGVPLCLVPDALRRFADYTDVPPGFDEGELIKTDTCARCDLRGPCFGVRRGYVEIHGADELRAVIR